MNTIEARKLALLKIKEHNLIGWKFKFDRALKRAGLCSYTKKTISLSGHFVLRNPIEEVLDTILHEIAHVIAGPAAKHGPIWKATCLKIGARPERCRNASQTSMPKGKYQAICGGCNKVFHMHRRPKRKYNCRKCGRITGALNFFDTTVRT